MQVGASCNSRKTVVLRELSYYSSWILFFVGVVKVPHAMGTRGALVSTDLVLAKLKKDSMVKRLYHIFSSRTSAEHPTLCPLHVLTDLQGRVRSVH